MFVNKLEYIRTNILIFFIWHKKEVSTNCDILQKESFNCTYCNVYLPLLWWQIILHRRTDCNRALILIYLNFSLVMICSLQFALRSLFMQTKILSMQLCPFLTRKFQNPLIVKFIIEYWSLTYLHPTWKSFFLDLSLSNIILVGWLVYVYIEKKCSS